MTGNRKLVRIDAIWHNRIADVQDTLTGDWYKVLLPYKPGLTYQVNDVYELDEAEEMLVVPGGIDPLTLPESQAINQD